ncbi:MAG: hypothetical protein HY445_01020 [Candidatus Niyogibacteria bacterium]|nr:hypothetical protein [Candidatus Niyogibacteria bacterium]
MIKKVIIFLIIAAILIIGYFVFFADKKNGTTNDFETLFPLSDNYPSSPLRPLGDKININTEKGTVTTDNFLQNASNDANMNDYVLQSADNYLISYYRKTNWFSLILLAPPLRAARVTAENEFLRILNIRQTEACKLSVSVAVIRSADQLAGTRLAGKDYRLSFCPDGIPF